MTDDDRIPLTGHDFPGQQALRASRKDLPGWQYLVTTCTHGRAPTFAEAQNAEIVVGALYWLRDQGRIRLHAFVVMPDHIHVVLTLNRGHTLAALMRTLKGWTSRQIGLSCPGDGPLWQPQYRDDAIRNYESMWARVNYVQENPVRKGLVERPEAYPFSSACEDHRGRCDPW